MSQERPYNKEQIQKTRSEMGNLLLIRSSRNVRWTHSGCPKGLFTNGEQIQTLNHAVEIQAILGPPPSVLGLSPSPIQPASFQTPSTDCLATLNGEASFDQERWKRVEPETTDPASVIRKP